jgi:histidinol phosphatase-like enzyme
MQNIIIWDNDGTITSAKNPNDTSNTAKIILPNVENIMLQGNRFNIICSGMKTPESESQNFNATKIIEKFKQLMMQLPIRIAIFSPAIGGTECWVVIKKDNNDFEIRKAHENPDYQHLIGKFKKPDIGMLHVIKDLLQEYGLTIHNNNTVFIGDAEQDRIAAHNFGMPFIWAQHLHQLPEPQTCLLFINKKFMVWCEKQMP